MRSSILIAMFVGSLTVVAYFDLPALVAAENEAAAEKEEAKKQDAKQAGKKKPKKRPSRVPEFQARPNPNAQRTPQSILSEQEMFVPEAAKWRQSGAKQQQVKQPQPKRPAGPQAAPGEKQPPPLPGLPRQEGLSASAAYRLQSMGTHVHLSPSMRWHLNRSQRGLTTPSANSPATASTAPGQGAEKFYPGVSRLPAQKPFADLERPASGLQSYWPLLLEGREDPNTGLIIWTLP